MIDRPARAARAIAILLLLASVAVTARPAAAAVPTGFADTLVASVPRA